MSDRTPLDLELGGADDWLAPGVHMWIVMRPPSFLRRRACYTPRQVLAQLTMHPDSVVVPMRAIGPWPVRIPIGAPDHDAAETEPMPDLERQLGM